jgi:hypothetical protein
MRTKSLAAISVAASVALTGCSSEDFSEFFSGQDLTTIQAEIVGETRSDVSFESESQKALFKWTQGDQFDVWTVASSTSSEFTNTDGGTTFSGNGSDLGKFATYPANIASGINDASTNVTFTLPDSYTYTDVYKADTRAVMLGTKTADKNYSFKHLAAALYFNVVDIPTSVTQFKVTAIGGEKINGEYTVDISGTTPTLSLADNNGSSSYTIKFPAFTDETTTAHFVVPIPVGTYSKGFKVELLNSEGTSVATSKLVKKIEIARADLGVYPTITVDATEINGTIEDPTEQAAALQSLQDAFTNGGEYTFTHNISLAGISLTLPADKSLTLDLNGKTLHVDATSANCIKVAGNLTIKDSQGTGKILDITGADSSIFWIGDTSLSTDEQHLASTHAASLTIENCTISAQNYAFIVRDKSKLTINGGTIYAESYGIYAFDNSVINVEPKDNNSVDFSSKKNVIRGDDNANVNITIKGGKLSSTSGNIAIRNKSSINVSGGTIVGSTYAILTSGATTTEISGSANITAETYAIKVQEIYLADNKTVKETGGTLKISGGTITAGGGVSNKKNYNVYGINMVTLSNATAAETGYSFEMTGGKVTSSGYGIALFGYSNAKVSNATVEGRALAFSGNGSWNNPSVIYTIENSTFNNPDNYAIYLPNGVTTTITGSTAITGVGGIAIQRGTLNIGTKGGSNDNISITSTATANAIIPVSGDGTNGLQNAVISAPARYGDLSVNIYGGKFTVQNTEYANLIDKTHNGHVDTYSTSDSHYDRTISIYGGTFNQDPAAVPTKIYTVTDGVATLSESKELNYVAEGYTSTNNGSTWTVAQSK